MIIRIDKNTTIDTAVDMTAEERHILQKLFAWKSLVDSVAQFRQKRDEAMSAGWNNSGPVRESRAMRLIIRQLENEVESRVNDSWAG